MTRFLVLILSVLTSVRAAMQPISLQKNAYTGVLVAIHRNVPEDLELLQKIENLFQKASPLLYKATRNQAFFKEVTIAIPDSWSQRPYYDTIPGDFFSNAHLQINTLTPNKNNAEEPYTLQPGGCGEPGQNIQYSANYIKKPTSVEPHRKNELVQNRLIQEWAHLRYGVFDEFGYPGSKEFPTLIRNSKGEWSGNACIKESEGSAGDCQFDINEGSVDPKELLNCSYIPFMDSNMPASIMFTAGVYSVEHFCDDDPNGGKLHNADGLNQQNKQCGGKSTWAIVSNHADFKDSTPGPDDLNTTTSFRYIRSPETSQNRQVLVLDTSASMKGHPMQLLVSAASRCIKDHFPNKGYLGIVSFSTRSHLLAPLTYVNDSTIRDQLVRLLPRRDDNGYTAIGRGLTRAMMALESEGKKLEGSRIVLVTDGEENMTPEIKDVLPDIVSKRVIVSAIAFGNKASETLETLTTSTGGKLYLFADISGNKPPSSLDYAFLEATTVQTDVDFKPVIIARDQIKPRAITTERLINIESALGKNTVFILKSPDISRMELELLNPMGRMYTFKSREYERDDNLERIKITVPTAKPGVWKVTYTRKSNVYPTVELSVQSTPLDPKIQPVRVRAWTSDAQLTFPASVKLFAEVRKGLAPVIKASVKAIVTRPDESQNEVILKDDGAAPDIEKDDGIYTAFFTNFTGSGRYGVVAKIVSNSYAQIKMSPDLKRKRRAMRIYEDEIEYTSSSFPSSEIEQFERVTDGGVFRLDNWTADAGDVIPPARIMDLTSLESNSAREVALQWTSPGNDLNSGDASSLEVRGSLVQSDLRDAFETCFTFTDDWVVSGSLTPMTSGQIQTLTLKLPIKWLPQYAERQRVTIYFAIRASDYANNTAEISNIGWTYLSQDVVEVDTYPVYLLVIGIIGGALLALIVTGLVYLVVRYRREHHYKGVKV